MERLGSRISLLLFLLMMGTAQLHAQQPAQDSVHVGKVWIGVEIQSLITRPMLGGYSLQPMLLYGISRYATLWGGAGVVKVKQDTLFNNLFDYRSQGWYAKAGTDLNLNFRETSATGFRLGGGFTYSRFTEKGELRFQYEPDLFEGEQEGNIYTRTIESNNWAAAFEFRQGFFGDFGKFALQIQTQLSYVLGKSASAAHPTHYIPGMGIHKPQHFLGDERGPRKVIPAAYLYLFYRLR